MHVDSVSLLRHKSSFVPVQERSKIAIYSGRLSCRIAIPFLTHQRRTTMTEVRKYAPISTILIMAVAVTTVAGWQTQFNESLSLLDEFLGISLWFAPLGYILILWYSVGTEDLNRPIVALGAVVVFALSLFLLFVPTLPRGLEWHYPIAAACLAYYISSIGDHESE